MNLLFLSRKNIILSHKTDWRTIKHPQQNPCGVSVKSWFFSSSLQNVERFHVSGKSMQSKVGRCLVTIIANGGETSLN